MLQWNELRITEDSKHLVIDVQVQNLEYYKNVHLQSLYMNVYKKSSDYVAPMPDSKSILLWEEAEPTVSYELYTQEDRENVQIGDTFWVPSTDNNWVEHIVDEANIIGIQNGGVSAYKQVIIEHHPKRIRKFLDIDGIANNLIFVYAIAGGEPTDDTPCGCKNHVLMGVVYNNQALYRNSINAMSTTNACTPNQELIDYILNVKSFEFSLKVGDYRAAIDLWNTTFKNNDKTPKKSCGCHGY